MIARCSVDYAGRLTAHLPLATRLLLVKADGSVLVHADGGSYKPLNWMSPPCTLAIDGNIWTVTNKVGERLVITVREVLHDHARELGVDPGLQKDGVEAHLQALLAGRVDVLGSGWRLVRREYPTPIGPVDLLCRDGDGITVAVEIKRRGEIDGQCQELVAGTRSVTARHVAVEVKRRATIDAPKATEVTAPVGGEALDSPVFNTHDFCQPRRLLETWLRCRSPEEWRGTMKLRKAVAALAAGVAIIGISAAPASAVQNDGLVYVDLADATIAVNVTIAEGAQIAADRCGLPVDPVVVLAQQADRTGEDQAVCQTPQGAVTLTDND